MYERVYTILDVEPLMIELVLNAVKRYVMFGNRRPLPVSNALVSPYAGPSAGPAPLGLAIVAPVLGPTPNLSHSIGTVYFAVTETSHIAPTRAVDTALCDRLT